MSLRWVEGNPATRLCETPVLGSVDDLTPGPLQNFCRAPVVSSRD